MFRMPRQSETRKSGVQSDVMLAVAQGAAIVACIVVAFAVAVVALHCIGPQVALPLAIAACIVIALRALWMLVAIARIATVGDGRGGCNGRAGDSWHWHR